MAERLNALVLKTSKGASPSEVRILLPPQWRILVLDSHQVLPDICISVVQELLFLIGYLQNNAPEEIYIDTQP